MMKRSWTTAIGIGLVLFASQGGASAQGVGERMITGAPPYPTYVQPQEPKRPTAVPTAPRSYLGQRNDPYARNYQYWDWPRSRARKLKPERR